MMRSLVLLLALGGCASASPGFLGATRHDVTVDGMRFAVHVDATRAQVIRRDRVTRAGRADVADRMIRAAEMASGCAVIANSLAPQGGPHSAVANVDLRCG